MVRVRTRGITTYYYCVVVLLLQHILVRKRGDEQLRGISMDLLQYHSAIANNVCKTDSCYFVALVTTQLLSIQEPKTTVTFFQIPI